MIKIVITKPDDPLGLVMSANRDRYKRKWLIPAPSAAPSAAQCEKPDVAPPTAERRSKLADKIREIWAANGFKEKV